MGSQRNFKIYRQLLQLDSGEMNDPVKEWAEELGRHFSREPWYFRTLMSRAIKEQLIPINVFPKRLAEGGRGGSGR